MSGKELNFFARGADIGWLSQLEANGITWQNNKGVKKDALEILKDLGINSIRLRVFVDPPANFIWDKPNCGNCFLGHTDQTSVVKAAQRAKAMGMKLMICFHYSDHFADPSFQDKPAAWKDHSFEQLKKDVYDHTFSVMTALKNGEIYPEWVQIGNEPNNGILWPDGSKDHFDQWAQLNNQGRAAVKAVSAGSKIMIHFNGGHDNKMFRELFDGLIAAGAEFDSIGASYYPHWDRCDYTQNIHALSANLNDMAARYGKEVMVAEVGGFDNNPTNSYDCLKATLAVVKAIPDNKGLGVFYWEPEASSSVLPDKYPLGACQEISKNVLRYTVAMNAFLD